jgi:hypothetical protein
MLSLHLYLPHPASGQPTHIQEHPDKMTNRSSLYVHNVHMWETLPLLCPEDEKKGANVKQKGRMKKVKEKWK